MRKCEKCKNDIADGDLVWHDHCADEQASQRYDDGFDSGRAEGTIDGLYQARREFADKARNRDVVELAEAIRVGDRKRAETALDLLASDIEGWGELVAKGRFSLAAKRAAA